MVWSSGEGKALKDFRKDSPGDAQPPHLELKPCAEREGEGAREPFLLLISEKV
jgi:hypothetical protein